MSYIWYTVSLRCTTQPRQSHIATMVAGVARGVAVYTSEIISVTKTETKAQFIDILAFNRPRVNNLLGC